jgi:hypothetical protein
MSTKAHMVKSFDDELDQLKTKLTDIGIAARVQLKGAWTPAFETVS